MIRTLRYGIPVFAFLMLVMATSGLVLAQAPAEDLSPPVPHSQVEADRIAEQIAPFIRETTALIVHVDIEQIDVGPSFAFARNVADDLFEKIEEPVNQEKVQEVKTGMFLAEAAAGTFLGMMQEQAGLKDVYVLFSLEDSWPKPSFLVVAPIAEGMNVQLITQLAAQADIEDIRTINGCLVTLLPMDGRAPRDDEKEAFELIYEKLETGTPDVRPELATAIASVTDGTAAQAVITLPKYSSRVIEEIMPTLPSEIGGGSSTLLTQGCLWAALGVDPQTPSVRLVIQAESSVAAVRLQYRIGEWLMLPYGHGDEVELYSMQSNFREVFTPDIYQEIVGILTPEIVDDQLIVEYALDESARTLISRASGPIATRIGEEFRWGGAVNSLKQITLSLHNYHDVNRALPAPASLDEDGKPLLSWRVYVLPYLEENDLYNEFHLDESWDSPHNIQLLDRMPNVYASTPGFGTSIPPGKTIFQAVTGESTIFEGPEGCEFRDITDGMSNTVLAVCVDPDHAVEWTKPSDWEFNLETSSDGLWKIDGGVWMAFCDGSVRRIMIPEDPTEWNPIFTKDGGEPYSTH